MSNKKGGKTVAEGVPVSLEKLTQPAILMLLAQSGTHGYALIQKLNQVNFIDGELEAATIYRALRRMEHDGFIVSRWEHGEFGPARREYELTEHGREHLGHWVGLLKVRMKQIESFISYYKGLKE